MSRKNLWLLGISLAVMAIAGICPTPSHAVQKKRYNIVFLFADDQRRDTIGALGNKNIRTPNLDKLVGAGTTFTRAYIMGSMSGAVCMPSRAMLMTGRNLFRAPLKMNDVPLLGEVLRHAGYLTFGTGKWHNGAPSFLRSFEFGDAVMLGGMSDHFNVPVNHRTRDNKMKRYDAKATHSSELFTNAALDFLKNKAAKRKKDQPFFLYVAFTAPHDPRDPPKKFLQPYYGKRPPVPKNFLPVHPFNLASDMSGRDENLGAWPRTEKMVRDQLAEYYGLITHMDQQIGRIVQTLRDIGEYENTIIVFAADNGLAVGSHGLLGKQSVYEHSVGVPLIFAGPGIPQNQRRDAFLYLFDIFPTLCEWNGVAAPKSLDGKSLAKIVSGKQQKVRDSLYFNYKYNQRAVRDENWKLIVYPKINHQLLFDLRNDPHEMVNLATQPQQQDRLKHLQELLRNWEAKAGAKQMPLVSANPQPKEINLIGRKRNPDRWQPEWIRKKYFGK